MRVLPLFIDVYGSAVIDGALAGVLDENPAEGRQDTLVTYIDQRGECFAEVDGGLLQVVVGDFGEKVVDLVGADIVYNTVTPAIHSVHRGQLTSHVAPDVVPIPGDALVAVVQERDDDDVGGEDAGGHGVVVQDRAQAEGLAAPVEDHAPGREAHQGQGALEEVASEHWEPKVKVRHPSGPVAVQQVHKPTDAEPEARKKEPHVILALPHGVEHLVFVHVAGVLVVVLVGQLPHEVRAEQEGVADVATDGVDQLRVGEGAVPGVVAHHEDPGEDGALDQPVQRRDDQLG